MHALCSNLETAVEDLSQMLEEEIEADTVKSLRQRMMDKTVGYILSFHLTRRSSHLCGV